MEDCFRTPGQSAVFMLSHIVWKFSNSDAWQVNLADVRAVGFPGWE